MNRLKHIRVVANNNIKIMAPNSIWMALWKQRILMVKFAQFSFHTSGVRRKRVWQTQATSFVWVFHLRSNIGLRLLLVAHIQWLFKWIDEREMKMNVSARAYGSALFAYRSLDRFEFGRFNGTDRARNVNVGIDQKVDPNMDSHIEFLN